MSFSEAFRIEQNVFKFSVDGKYIAYAFQNNVFVRNAHTSKIVRSFPTLDIVQYVEWSPDSKFLLCASYQRGVVQVLSLQFPKWKCKIKESEVGIARAVWSPDSRHIVTVGNFNVWVCIWSLSDFSVKYIYNLKSVIDDVLQFSLDGSWLAVIEHHENSYCISTFSTSSWHLSKRYSCAGIEIIGGLLWSPDSSTICVWDKRTDVCRVHIISLLRDSVCTFERESLGVRTLSWSPSGQFLSLGCYDGKVRLLNNITWSQLMVFEHSTSIDSPACTVYKEVLLDGSSISGSCGKSTTHQTVFKEVTVRPVLITTEGRTSEGMTANCGIWLNCFSSCAHFLVTSCSNMPATLWIWNIKSGILHTFLAFHNPVVDIAWDPSSLRLAAVSQGTNVRLWTPASGASIVQTPESELWDVCVSRIRWHPLGHTLAVSSRNIMMLLWFTGITESS